MIQRFKKLPIRHKLSFIVMVTSGALIGLMATYFIIDRAISYRRQMVDNINTLAKVIGTNSTAALSFDDPETAKEILGALNAEPHVLAACIYNIDGTIYATYTQVAANASGKTGSGDLPESIHRFIDNFSDKPRALTKSYHYLDLSNPIELNHKPIGHVAIRADLSELNTRLLWFIVFTGISAVFLFLSAHIICSRLQRVITEPLLDMVSTMKIVSSERDYSQRVVRRAQDELGTLNDSFNDMLSQIQDRDRELATHKDRLEELVSKRTSELQKSNDQLKTEIAERIQMQEELASAQKMEAIGMLAAGVAHDLNNLLSGVTSYPEFLLTTIPQDSPLRKPLKTIQDTGIRAAAIVDDLLILSRRSVAQGEIIQMGSLIEDYLGSPELENILSSHPYIEIRMDIAPDLMPITGSKVHLQKMIMNLVINAVEAMLDGGRLDIRAQNVYINSPINGYETVSQGDYVKMTLADTGTGIEPELFDRIFEPFFTKKQLGRSGTGLGMAIVWGAIKDHKGYITVDSKLGQGAIFTIYLPVFEGVKKSTPKPQSTIADNNGSGEFILIVDDCAQQREIASAILIKLGYKVDTVSSGEAAVEYIKAHSPDLILLDMIMTPGIGGLETYKRIIDIKPDQRAVIASGYSESEQVKQTQALGAGQYIRKPYAIAKIAEAIRIELER